MEHLLGQEWEIVPAGGATGEAFFAKHKDQRLFLKRNSSPFLAVLSAEGIVPKLVWTKRLENGDVITAQQWLNGRELKPMEMGLERVAKLLKKIHRSEPMVGMLRRLGKSSMLTGTLFKMVIDQLDNEVLILPESQKAIAFLKREEANVVCKEKAVCHGDVNHNNWLLSDNNQLYLIDWDGAMIADPAIDLGLLLYSYVSEQDWENWLTMYGAKMTSHLMLRMKWYAVLQTLSFIQWNKGKGHAQEVDKWVQFLNNIL